MNECQKEKNEERKEQRSGRSKEGFATNIKMIVQINRSINVMKIMKKFTDTTRVTR